MRKFFLLFLSIIPILSGCKKQEKLGEIHEFTIVYNNSRQGEIEPCGCVDVQLGGIQKHSQLVKDLTKKEKSVLHLDGGDLIFSSLKVPVELKEQWNLRGNVVVEAYFKMNLDATTVGESDLAFGKQLYEDFVRDRLPIVTTNIINTENGKTWFAKYLVKDVSGLKIGIIGLINPDLIPKDDLRFTGLKFLPYKQAASEAINELREKKKVDLIIVLAHLGVDQELALPGQVEGIDVLVGGHGTDEPRRIGAIGDTLYLRSSFEGRKVGVVKLGFSSKRKGWLNEDELNALIEKRESLNHSLETLLALKEKSEYKHNRIYKSSVDKQIEESKSEIDLLNKAIPNDTSKLNWYEGGLLPILPEASDDKDVYALVDNYKNNLKKLQSGESVDITKVQGPIYATYQYCSQCHQKQYEVWSKSAHAKAWETLVKKHQEYNLECVACHSVGFKDKRGYGTALTDLQRTVEIQGVKKIFDYKTVQCENCHGARSTHPFDKTTGLKKVSSSTCVACHDPKNSPNFNITTYWVLGDKQEYGHEPICIKGLPK